MPKRTEAWWVCGKCGGAVIEVGVKGVHETMLKHRRVCDPIAGYSIKQLPQGTRRAS